MNHSRGFSLLKNFKKFVRYLVNNPLMVRIRTLLIRSETRKKELNRNVRSFPIWNYFVLFVFTRNYYLIKSLFNHYVRYKRAEFKLTVIMPTYNSFDSFRRAIDSVLEQKTDFKYKIVITDDCSSDGTQDLIVEYQKKYPKTVSSILRPENVGVPMNHFLAAKESVDTEYFFIMDDDDYLTNMDKLQIQVDVLDKNFGSSICSHATLRKYVNSNKTDEIFPKLAQGVYHKPFACHTSSKIIRTTVLERIVEKDEPMLIDDTSMSFYSLTCGTNYFLDSIMSVYVDNASGIWTGKSEAFQKELDLINKTVLYKNMNKCFIPRNKIDLSVLKDKARIRQILGEYTVRG